MGKLHFPGQFHSFMLCLQDASGPQMGQHVAIPSPWTQSNAEGTHSLGISTSHLAHHLGVSILCQKYGLSLSAPHRCCSFQAGVNRAKANSGLLTETWSYPELGTTPNLTLSTTNLNLFFRVAACKKSGKQNPRPDRPEWEAHMNS